MSKPREFWISELPKDYGNTVYCLKQKTENYIHVIEYSAYEKAVADVAMLKEALEFYANRNNWVRDLNPEDRLNGTHLNEFLRPVWGKIVRDSGATAKQALKKLNDSEGEK